MAKVPISWFVGFLETQLNNKCGYIMGSFGQNPKKWAVNSWWFTQYSGSQRTKALYWRDHAPRVFDCNGLAEAAVLDYTGNNINSYARVNFHTWCASHNGWGTIPSSERKPGMAVFKASTKGSWSTIHHVGYLWKPVKADTPTGDWYIIEAKGVMYGVIKSKLSDGGWNAWGRMTKYFSYSATEAATKPSVTVSEHTELDRGDKGVEVKKLQELLLIWNANCLPAYGADGDFGTETYVAVKAFQKDAGLTVDGIVGSVTWAALLKLTKESEELTVTGGSVNIRSGAGTDHDVVGVAHKGERMVYTETQLVGNTVWYHVESGWLSGKYASEV